MKRKFLALFCIVALVVLSLASCDLLGQILGNTPDEQPDDVCEHTYSDKWSTSSTEHWHAATCEHAELKADVASHADADQDGKCDVCDYEIGHEHTYENKWTTDETHHWKVATCAHTEEKGELGAHADTNSDGACDTCSAHVHVLNLYGKCTVCGKDVVEVDITDINVVLPIVLSNSGKVVGGNIAYENVITDLELEYNDETMENEIVPYNIISTKDVVFLLGNNASYYKVVSAYDYGYGMGTDTQEKWYELLADGTAFGVYQDSYDGWVGDFEVDGAASENDLIGYYFAVSTLTDAYGAENLLQNLFDLSQSASALDYTYLYNEETAVYSFSFGYLAVNSDTGEGEGDHADYYELEVSFTVSESGMLTSLDVACDCYTNSLEDEIDNDYTYNQNEGTITMKDTAAADTYTFSITQNEGVRTYVSEHPKSEFYPESFDAFTDAELTNKLGDTATIVQDNTLVIYFGNFLPENTDVKYIIDTFSTNLSDESPVFYWAYDGTASFYCDVPGTYPIEFTLGDETFSFTLVVEEYVPEEIEYPENSVPFVITGDDTYAWTSLVTFTAPEDGDYTFYVPAGIGAWDKASCDSFSGAPYVDFYSEYGGTFTVSVKAGETYEFYVSATEKLSSYLTYTVDEYTGSGDNGGSDVTISDNLTVGNNTVSFTAEEIALGAGSKTFAVTTTANYTFKCDIFVSSVVDSNGNAVEKVNYEYPLVAGETYTVTFGMFFIANITAGTPVSINITATEIVGGDTDGDELTVTEGTYTGTDMFGNSPLTVVVEGNTVTFNYNHPLMGLSSIVATYEIVDGAAVLYGEDGAVLHPLAGSLTIDAEGNPVSASYNGNDYTLSAGGSSDTPVVDEALETLKGYYLMVGYEVIIYGGADYEGVYFFNAWSDTADIYYTLTAIDNGDGTYTLVLALKDPADEDTFGFLYETFTAIVDGEYVTLVGPELVVEVVDYPDLVLGNNEITITAEDIENSSMLFDFVVENTGYYTITGIEGSFLTADGDFVGYLSGVLEAGNYVINLSVWEATAGNCNVTITYAALSDLTAEQILDAACGEYHIGDLTYSIYGGMYYEGVYYLNIYNTETWSPDVYYIVESATKNEDGTCTIVLALNTDKSESDDFGFAGNSIVISYFYGWDINHIKELKVAQGTYVGTDYYGNSPLTVTVDANTVTFVFDHPYMGMSTNVATYAIVDGAVVLYDELGNAINPLAGMLTIDENGIPVSAAYNGNNYILAAPGGEVEEQENVLNLGDNTVAIVDTSFGDTYYLPVNDTETVTYVITVGANGVLIINGYDIYFEGNSVEITVAAGELVSVGLGAYSYSDNVAGFTVAVQGSEVGGNGDDDNEGGTDAPALSGSGTSADPYVITSLPYEIVYEGAHDVYYCFVATEDCTLTINYTAGSYVSELINFDKDDKNYVYTVYCTAGETITINTWATNPANTYTYVISYSA